MALPQCGLATKSDGSRVAVVAGGGTPDYGTTETYIYDVSLGIFLPGPPLPETRMFGRAVQYQNSFIIVGGTSDDYSGFDGREDILLYEPDAEMWVTLPQKLTTPDYVTAAVLVSNDFNVNCP